MDWDISSTGCSFQPLNPAERRWWEAEPYRSSALRQLCINGLSKTGSGLMGITCVCEVIPATPALPGTWAERGVTLIHTPGLVWSCPPITLSLSIKSE